MKHLYRASFAAILLFFTSSQTFAQNILTYAGNAGKERFNDVVELSNGKVLVAGEAENLAWLPGGTPVTTLTVNLAPGITSINSSDSKIAFLMLLNSTQTTIEQVVRFPAGTVASVNRIRTTNQIGSTTGNMVISGMRTTASNDEDGYFIARLNNNFVAGLPTACSWYYPVSAKNKGAGPSAYKTIQPWDVGNDGSVVFGWGLDYDWDWAAINKLTSAGALTTVENWPYQTDTVGPNTERNYRTASSYTPGSATFSGIILKAYRSGSLRSSVNGSAFWNGYNYNGLDENNKARKGKFPDDFFAPEAEGATPGDGRAYGRLTQGTNYNTSVVGYRTNFRSTRPTGRLGGIVIDRRDNHMYFGYSTQTAFWSVTKYNGSNWVPDFEPVVVAMDNTGGLKWWARLYDQKDISLPDQYIDGVDIDYASDKLVVLARQHGFSGNMFWQGNQLFFNSGASGFKNSNSGINTIETGHYSWIGKYDLIRVPSGPIPVQPKLLNSTFVAEYSDNPTGLGSTSTDPKMDNWKMPNTGFPDLNTTKMKTRINVAANGSVTVIGTGRRTITTVDAHQKMPKPGTGSISSWNQFIRIYRPDLSYPVYSTLLTGAWDTLTGVGGSNTEIEAAFPFSNGVYVAGYHTTDVTGSARPNNIPTANVPAWGNATANSESAIFGRLGFINLNPISLNLTQNTFCSQSGSNTATIGFTPPPNFLVNFNPGNQFQIELSDATGKFAEDGGTTTVLGSLTSTSNATQSLTATIPVATPAGTGYGIRARGTNPVTPGFWYSASIVIAAPGTPGTISGPVQVCSNASSVTPFTINKVANATTYEWEVSPTVSNQLDPCDLPTCAGKISGSDTSGSVVWNPSYSGTATVRVRAVNACGVSAWQTFSVTNISPCISNTGDFNGCAGASFTVNFTVPVGVTVSGTNQYTAELSDVSGNFPGTIIGTVNNITGGAGPRNGAITATVPSGQAAGSLYRIRVNGVTGNTPSVSSLPSSSLSIIRNIPSLPGTPTGAVLSLCLNSISNNYTYSVAPAAGATDYEWRIIPDSAGTIISGTDATATIAWNNFVGTPQISVRAKNSCGNSNWSTALTVTIQNCNSISGTTPAGPFCPGQTGVTVQIATPAGVSYPSTNTITIDILDAGLNTVSSGLGSTNAFSNISPFPALTGSTASFTIPYTAPGTYFLRMRSTGGGTRLGALFPITISGNAPTQPGAISGTTTPTCGQVGAAYSISAVSGATGYTWTIFPGTAGTITPSGVSATITYAGTFQGATATLMVTANNTCGSSVPASQSITLGCAAPTAPTVPVPSVNGNFRTRQSGNWFTLNTWETHNGTSWIPATASPTNASGVIQLVSGHTVGISWPQNVTSTNSPSTSIQFNGTALSSNNSLNGLIVGNGGYAQRTQNGSSSWTAVTTGTTNDLTSVTTYNGGRYAISVGNSGTFLRGDGGSNNALGGLTWSAVTPTANGNPSITENIQCVDVNFGFGIAVGSNGRMVIIHSSSGNNGDLFNDRTSVIATTTNLRGCYMHGNGTNYQGHVVGENGYYRRTTAAAWSTNPTWNAEQTISGNPTLNSVAFNGTASPGATGIIVGNGGVIFRTVNSGANWTAITSPTSENLLFVRYATNGDLFASGNNGILLWSGNDGQSWRILNTGSTATLRCVNPTAAADRQQGFAVGDNGTLIVGVTSGSNSTFDQIVIESGANMVVGLRDVTINDNSNTSDVDLDVTGTLTLTGRDYAFNAQNVTTRTVFRSVSNLIQDRDATGTNTDLMAGYGGTGQMQFMSGSTVQVIGIRTGTGWNARNQPFSNFIWNSPNQTSNLILTNPPITTTNNFRVQSTGTGNLNISNSASTTQVYNWTGFQQDAGTFRMLNQGNNIARLSLNSTNFVHNGGVFYPSFDQGLVTLNLTNFTQTGSGTIDLNITGSQNTNRGTITNITGNFNQTGGTITQGAVSGTFGFTNCPIFFKGTGAQNLAASGTWSANPDIQFLNTGSGISLTGNASFGSIPVRWISGNVNTGAFTLTSGPLSLRGIANTTFATLSGTGGWNTNLLSIVSGRLDNTADALTVTNPSNFAAVTGGDRQNYIIGSLRKIFGISASGTFTYPIGTSAGFKPLTLNSLVNDATQKTLGASVTGTGANQASGTKIQNVGTQAVVGGLNWRVRRTDGATGSLTSLASIKVTNDSITTDHRLGQSNTNLTSGFASVGGSFVKNTTFSVATARYYDFTSTKPLDLTSIAGSTGTFFAIGGPSTVTPPGGGYSVGPTGNYPNLTSVAAEYNDVRFTAPATFTFQSSYEGRSDNGGTEVFPITFSQNQTQPVTIRYTGATGVETSNTGVPNGNPLIVLDGADNLTFLGNDKWRFLNKSAGANPNAVRLQNGATYNTFKDMILEGSDETPTFTGTVFLGSSPSIGNSFNTFESNRISSNADRRLEPIVIGISNNFMPGLPYGAIIGASNASPIVITTSKNHGFSTGQNVNIEGVHGNYAANGNNWEITVTGPKTFSLDGSTGSGAFRINYDINALVANNPVTVQTADNQKNTINHGIPIGVIQPIAGPGLGGVSYAATNNDGDYYAKAISATELEIYRDIAATNPLIVSSGTYTPNTGSIRFHTDNRLWKAQASAPVLITQWQTFGNGSVFLSITNVTKLGSGLIEITTSANHNMISGWAVRIADVDGSSGNLETEVNRYTGWQIDVTGTDKFTLRNSNGANGGVDVSGAYVSGGRFLVSPVVVSSNNHGLISGNPVTINGVQGVYMANGTHYARKLDNNAFSIWENASGADSTKPRYLSFPGVDRLGGSGALNNVVGYTGTAVFSRPGIPMVTNMAVTNCTYINNTPSAGQVTFYYTVANGTFGANAIGQRFYASVSGVNGFGGTSPNQEWQGSNAFGIVTATNQFTVTITGSTSGSYTSGGIVSTRITINEIRATQFACNGNIQDTWVVGSCNGPVFQPTVSFSKNSGLRVGDPFTISGVTGPETGHGLNGTFMALTPGFSALGGSTSFSSLQNPTTAPIINTGGVPNMTADPNPPFNGQVVAAYDILATRCVYSQNTGNSLNSNNKIKDNEISQFDEVAVSVTSLGNGSNWEITGNSIFNKISQPPAVGATNFQAINFVPGLKSNNNTISNNFIGGQEAGAQGNAMVFSRGVTLECFNINVGNEIVTKAENNLIRNINTVSFSGATGAVYAFNLQGGRIDVKNNVFGGTDANLSADTIRASGGTGTNYFLRNLSTDSVSVVNNTAAHIAYPATSSFVISHESAGKILIKGNTVKKISAGYGFNGFFFSPIRIGSNTEFGGYNTSNGLITLNGHGLVAGDFVWSRGNTGNTSANGMFRVTTPISANTFTLQGYSGSGSSTNTGSLFRLPNRTGMSFTLDSNQVTNINITSGRPDVLVSQLIGYSVFCSDYKGIITRNRFYNNSAVTLSGIAVIGSSPNDLLIANNQLTMEIANLTQSGWFGATSHGIWVQTPGIGSYSLPRIYYNTIWQRNHSGSATQPQYGFLKSGPGRAVVRNNIFFTSTSLRPGPPAYSAGVTDITNWQAADFTNNLLYAEGANAFLGWYNGTTINTIATWQGFAGAGSVNNIFNFANFEENQPAANGDLSLSPDNCPIKDKGINVAYRADYDSLLVRDVSKPDLGSNEFSRNLPTGAFWIGAVNNDWNTDANWCDQRVPLADEDVTITNAPPKPFMPIISTSDAVCRNLNIANNSGSMLVVYGENAALTVSGKTPKIQFSHDNLANINGSVRFISDSVQNIPGASSELNFNGRNVLTARPRISALTYTNSPDVITITTSANHNLALGDVIILANVRGASVPAKPLKVIQVVNTTQVRVNGFASGTYTANSGSIIPTAMIPINAMANGPTAITITSPRNHNLQVGQMVAIAGSKGNAKANGSFEVATVPTTTTFTINVVSTDAFVYDTNAFAFPGRTGFYDIIVDGNSQKAASGIIEARTLTLAGGNLDLPFSASSLSNTLIRDSLIIEGARTLNATGSNYRFGNLINKGGTVNLGTANVQVNDSLTTRGGIISINGTSLQAKNMSSLQGGIINLGSGIVTTTVTDSLILRGGTINNDGGDISVNQRVNLSGGMVNFTQTDKAVVLNSAAGTVIGGSTNSFINGILRQTENASGTPLSRVDITNVANTTPVRITATGHNLETGDWVSIQGSISAINRTWKVTRISATQYDLVGSTASGSSGATIANGSNRIGFAITGSTTNANPIVINHTAHGLSNGDIVLVGEVTGNTNANGIWEVSNVSANSFELKGSIGNGTSGAGIGTVIRTKTRFFPIGKGTTYRPISLHFVQGTNSPRQYSGEFKNQAPQVLNLPTNQPVYGGVGTESISTVSLGSFTTLSQLPAVGIQAGSVTMSYDNSEGVTINNRRGVTIVKDSVPHDTWLHLYANAVDSVSAIKTLRSQRPFYTFSDFTLGILVDVPLPLDLIKFKSTLIKDAVSSNWTTVNEKDLQSFVLERSVDGSSYTSIHTAKPKGGHGQTVYQFNDEEALKLGVGRLYYRLRMVETSGRISYSQTEIVNLNAGALEQMQLYPIPFSSELEVGLVLKAGEEVSFNVSDILGRNVWNQQTRMEKGLSNYSLKLGGLPKGAYFLKVKTAGNLETRKIVKQ